MDADAKAKDNKGISLGLDPDALAAAILRASSLLIDRSEAGRTLIDKIIVESLVKRYGADYAESLKINALIKDNLGTYDELLAEAIKGDDAMSSTFWLNDGKGNISFSDEDLNALEEIDGQQVIPMIRSGQDEWKVSK